MAEKSVTLFRHRLLNSTTDALGRTTNYTYNANNNNLLSVSSGGMTNSYTYAPDGKLTDINVNNGVKYKFEYDGFGRTTNTKVGNGTSYRTLSSLEYNSQNLMSKQTYGNNDFITFSYDNLDRITEKKYNNDDNKRVTYQYGNDGTLASKTDYFTGETEKYVYDLAGRAVRQKTYKDGVINSSLSYTYADKTNYLTGVKHYSPLGTQNIGYRYGNISNGEMPDQIYGVTWNGTERVNYTYDGFGRLTNKQIKPSATAALNNTYTYEDVENTNKTTTLVKSVETAAGRYTYTYDAVGNIISINDGTYTTSYVYDSLNQLVRENDQRSGITYTYTYQNGNIIERTGYEYTTGALGAVLDTKTWQYGDSTWSDLLTNFNGQQITYDTIGNPITINDISFSWNGRQLKQVVDGNSTYAYQYNADGQRISKTVNGLKTEFVYNGSILAGQTTGIDNLTFMYDNNGDTFGFTYNGTDYYYIKNAQNDVTAVTDTTGEIVCRYYYDAWGEINSITGSLASTIGELNPIRYRSYFYDSEINMYYLNSRYYSPDLCRFLNSDGICDTNTGMLSHNIFTYCNNNPVNFIDSKGTWIGIAIIAICTIAGIIFTAVGSGKTGSCISDIGPSVYTVANGVKIGSDSYNDMQKYTEDVVRTGTDKKYKPKPKKNFKGAVSKKENNINDEQYKFQCFQAYQNMIENCIIAKGQTYEEIQQNGKDKELIKEMIVWDNSMYHSFVYDHIYKQEENLCGG